MTDIAKLGLKLFALAAAAGLALGATNAITEGPIAVQTEATAVASRQAVLPSAADFKPLDAAEGLDWTYAGYAADGSFAGNVGQITVQGYGGEIEVVVGVDKDGAISGVSVGGANFSETAGLGAKTKEPWFGAQFAGKTAPVELKKNGGEIDAVTSATISSTAVTKGVSSAAQALAALPLPTEVN